MIRRPIVVVHLLLLGAALGCTTSLVPTPRIYVDADPDPFASVPPALRSSDVPLVYATDRKPEADTTELDRKYTWERNRALGFGIATVRFGVDLSWDDLVAASRTKIRTNPVTLTLMNVEELGQVPEVAYDFCRVGGKVVATPNRRESVELAEHFLLRTVESRLEAAPRKDIFLFVHGYANSFQDATFTASQVWHFLGRPGVPFVYSWPAGSGGLLRGYTHDRESGEYTVFHLKQVLRLLARIKGLNKIHAIAHSRGTDVFMTAVRELFLEDGRQVKGDCFASKLGTVVLAAPDLDFDVLSSRVIFEGLLLVPDRLVVYVSEGDRAIGISSWLFTSLKRLGQLQSADLSPDALERLRQYTHIEVIDARVHGHGSWGHDYFYAHPSVLSDLIWLLRDGKEIGGPGGRPLHREEESFWILDNDYPEPAKK